MRDLNPLWEYIQATPALAALSSQKAYQELTDQLNDPVITIPDKEKRIAALGVVDVLGLDSGYDFIQALRDIAENNPKIKLVVEWLDDSYGIGFNQELFNTLRFLGQAESLNAADVEKIIAYGSKTVGKAEQLLGEPVSASEIRQLLRSKE